MKNLHSRFVTLAVVCGCLAGSGCPGASSGGTNSANDHPDWLTRPISLADALNVAEQHNGTLLKAKKDLAATAGVAIQTRAIVIPKIQANGSYQAVDKGTIDIFPIGNLGIPGAAPISINYPAESWSANLRLVQSIYEGGKMTSGLRTARLLNEQAVLQYQTALADVLTEVRVAYYDILSAARQVEVQQASVNLLTNELQDTQRRFDAGTVPRFNVLRAEVELANARPRLIHAENDYRISKNNLSNLLGYDLPRNVWDDIPIQLSDRLEATPATVDLPDAIEKALQQRPELGSLRKEEALRKEGVVGAKAGYKPRLELFAGYGARSSQFGDFARNNLYGWTAGAQASWDIFDGMLTRGKVREATALEEKAHQEIDDTARRIELEVRTRYSQFVEARQVLDSEEKVQEQADEALRLARSRAAAGAGTQLDVLSAQTSLTEARSTQVLALHDYAVALARLERAIGTPIATQNAAAK